MKNIKRVLLLGVIGLFVPAFVSAATLELDTNNKTKTANTYTVPVKLVLADGETPQSFKNVRCSTSYDDVECTVSNVTGGVLPVTEATTNGSIVATLTIKNNNSTAVTIDKAKFTYETYTVDINTINLDAKPEERKASTNAKLKKITVNTGKISPSFDPEKTDYTIYDISDTVKSILFDYDCQDVNCNVHIDGGVSVSGEQKVELNIGENEVKVVSTAEDGVSKITYKFNVFRGETSYNSAKLKSLVVGEYELSPKFDKDKTEYTLQVPYSLVTLATAVTYEPEDDKATVEIKGHDNLVVGENTIEIKVTNVLDTETKTYKVVVTRLDDQDIIVKAYKDGKITFVNSNEETKELTEEEFEKQYPAEWAKIKNKTYKFDDEGNIIKDEDKEDTTTDKEEKKDSKTWLIIVLIVVGIIIIAVSGYFIFRKKPEKKDKDKDSKKEEVEEKKVDEEPTEEETKEEEKATDEDLLNLSDDADIEINIRSNPDAELDYDVETEIESVEHTASRRSLDDTVDIDEALSDLMSTRQYNFDDEEEK